MCFQFHTKCLGCLQDRLAVSKRKGLVATQTDFPLHPTISLNSEVLCVIILGFFEERMPRVDLKVTENNWTKPTNPHFYLDISFEEENGHSKLVSGVLITGTQLYVIIFNYQRLHFRVFFQISWGRESMGNVEKSWYKRNAPHL